MFSKSSKIRLCFSIFMRNLSHSRIALRGALSNYLLAMPRAPLLTGKWRRAEVSIPIRVLAVPTVFKTVLRAVAINPPNPRNHRLRVVTVYIYEKLVTKTSLIIFDSDGNY